MNSPPRSSSFASSSSSVGSSTRRSGSDLIFNDYNCPLCETLQPLRSQIIHIPICYRELCQKLGAQPMCTCDDCGGRRTHPYSGSPDRPPVQTAVPRFVAQVTPNENSLPGKRRRISGASSTVNLPKDSLTSSQSAGQAVPASLLTPRQLTGKDCAICGNSKRPKNGLPLIGIGQYRTLMLCVKSHLGEYETQAQVENLLDSELQRIEKYGDSKSNVIQVGSDDEDVIQPPTNVTCEGLLSLEDKTVCVTSCPGYLWIKKDASSRAYFCKGSHLIRYMMNYHMKGRKGGNKKSSKNASQEKSQPDSP